MSLKQGLFWSSYYKYKTRALKIKGFRKGFKRVKTDYNQFLSFLGVELKTKELKKQEKKDSKRIKKSFRRLVKRQVLKRQNKKLRASLNYRIAHSTLLFNEKKPIISKVDKTKNKTLLSFSKKLNSYDCVNLFLDTQNYNELLEDYQIKNLTLNYLIENKSKLNFYLLKKNLKC